MIDRANLPIVILIIFRLSAPGLVTPYYSTTAGEITVLVASLISIVSYVVGLRVSTAYRLLSTTTSTWRS